MRKYEALGVVETQYFAIAMEMLDQMCKSSNIQLLANENYLGGRLVSLIIGGSVSEVNVAIEVARKVAETKQNHPLKMALVINNPHSEIMKYILPGEEEKRAIPPQEIEPNKVSKKGKKSVKQK